MIPELPNSIDAEKALLASILIRPDLIVEIADILEADDFYREIHSQIYAAMRACWHRNIKPDVRMVTEQLGAQGINLSTVAPLIAEFLNETVVIENILSYARFVNRFARLRRLITTGAQITRLGYDLKREIDEIEADAQALLNQVVFTGTHDGLVPLSAIIDEYYEDIKSERPAGTPTGFRDYDELTGGLHRSDLVTLAARPSVGKTAWLVSLIDQLAERFERTGEVMAVFSLEMSRGQLLQRLFAMRTGEDLAAVRNLVLTPEQTSRVFRVAGDLYRRPILIDHKPGQRIEQVRAKLMRLASQHPIGLVAIDYLQLMQGDRQRSENRVQEVSEISRGLKNLARELDVPVLALSQLSRAVEGRTSHVPMLSDLRESGAIEQDSDQVMFIYREELYNRETDKKGIAELHIAKHRNGPLGVVPMRFDASTTRFSTLTYRSPDGY